MIYEQLKKPNLKAPARAGWCLGFMDDSVNAKDRCSTAQIAYDRHEQLRQTRKTPIPKNVFVPIWFSLSKGQTRGFGHVAWCYIDNNGYFTAWDSDTQSGLRGVYKSIQDMENWFSGSGAKYLGWTTHVEEVPIIKELEKKPENNNNITQNSIYEGENMIFTAKAKTQALGKFKLEDIFIFNISANTYKKISNPEEVKYMKDVTKKTTGKDLPHYESTGAGLTRIIQGFGLKEVK